MNFDAQRTPDGSTDGGPYRSARLVPPARPPSRAWVVGLGALVGVVASALVLMAANDPPAPLAHPTPALRRGPLALVTATLPPLTDATALLSDGVDLCVRTAQNHLHCDARDGADHAGFKSRERHALQRDATVPQGSQLGWADDSGIWVSLAEDLSDAPSGQGAVTPRIAHVGTSNWELHDTGAVRLVSSFPLTIRWMRGLPRARELDTDGVDVCALSTADEPWCWSGAVPRGALAARRVTGVRAAQNLSVSDHLGCALVGAKMQCWALDGRGGAGEARRVPWPAEIARFARYGRRLCAIERDGSVRCGTLGAGDGFTTLSGLAVVAGARGARDVAMRGVDGACALMPEGNVRCWSARVAATLSGSLRRRDVFAAVVGLPPVAQIAASERHACARTRAGEVYCWGANDAGQIDASGVDRPTPVRIEGPHDVTTIHVGRDFSCAQPRNQRERCWGQEGTHGAAEEPSRIAIRGDGHLRYLGSDRDVPGVEGVTAVVMRGGLVIALHEDGSVSSAGDNDFGQLGDGSPSPDTPADAVVSE